MKAKTAKKKIIVSLIISLIVIGLSVATIVYLSSLEAKAKQKHSWLKNNISSLQKKIDGLSEKALQFTEAISVWESFSDDAKKLKGIRIDSAKNVIEGLERKYKLSDFKISFSKPEDINTQEYPDLLNDTIKVSTSSVTMSFAALTDEVVYNFLVDLENYFPGYIHIESFSINSKADLTKEHLTIISQGNYPSLVETNIVFLWRDFKYEAPTSQNSDIGKNE